MNALIAAQGILLYLLLGWKLSHLARAPHDLPLRCVTACLACAAAAYPFGIAATLRPTARAAPWFMLSQNGLLLATVYALDCFLLFSLLPAPAARQASARRAIVLTVAVTAMAISAALTPPGTDMADQSVPAVAMLYLTFDLCIAYLLADAWRWTRRSVKDVAPTLALGLRLASAGLAMMVAGVIPLAAVVMLRWARLPSPVAMITTGRLLVIPGILVFLAGICYPGAVMRLSAARVWGRHRRTYQQLAPLWTELHRAFPQDALARVPAAPWRDALSPWGVHRRYYRRVIECRDGLVRISPRLAPQDAPANAAPLAERLLAALRTLPAATETTGHAVAVAIPATAGLDDDAGELVALARQLAAARARNPRPRLAQAAAPTEDA